MSTTNNNNTVKTSYKNVVALEDIQHSCELENPKSVIEYEYDSLEVIQPLIINDMLQCEKLIRRNPIAPLSLPMKYLMSDIIEPLGDLTNEIKEVYELKGIANTLKLSDVLNAFESSLSVTYLGDIEAEHHISDDDANATTTLA
jgi:hypothetical protein